MMSLVSAFCRRVVLRQFKSYSSVSAERKLNFQIVFSKIRRSAVVQYDRGFKVAQPLD